MRITPSVVAAATLIWAALALVPRPLLAQVTLTVSSDKEAYDYGEPIEVTVRMENNTSSAFSIFGSSSCQADFKFDAFDHSVRPCTTDLVETRFNPGGWRAWTWVLDPATMGLPGSDGSHTIVGFHPGTELADSVTVSAPAFLGGRVSVAVSPGTSEAAIASVRDSLHAVVLYSYESGAGRSERWQISGMTVDAAVNRWSVDARFSLFEAWRLASAYVITGRELAPEVPSSDTELAVYPNPCTSICRVESKLGASHEPTVAMHDVLGRLVPAPIRSRDSTDSEGHQWAIEVSGLTPGVYLISVRAGTEVSSVAAVVSR